MQQIGMQIPKTYAPREMNKKKEAFYRANTDVLDGMEICATLQFSTCLVCGVMDGRRYGFNERVPQLPLHDGCRCVLLPVTPLSDYTKSSRPAEMVPVAYFAEQRYDAGNHKKKFAELAKNTQKKYYLAEEKILMQQGTKVWQQFNGNYCQWFATLPQKYQKIIVGSERFRLMKKHNLNIADFVDIKNFREYTIEEIERRLQL